MPILKEWGKEKSPGPLAKGPLTTQIHLLGLHCQVVPRVHFSVQFFVVVNAPFLGYSKELALVTGPADGVPVQGKEFQGIPWLSIVLCGVQTAQKDRWGPLGSVPCIIPHPSLTAHCAWPPRESQGSERISLIWTLLRSLGWGWTLRLHQRYLPSRGRWHCSQLYFSLNWIL